MIYFIEAVGSDAVKIGACRGERELRAMLSALREASPGRLVELGRIAPRHVDVAPLHDVLKRHRLHDDWFRLSASRGQIRKWIAGQDLPTSHAAAHAGYRKIALTAKVEAVPHEAMAEILEKFREAKGDLKATAPLLGCTWRTLYRWIDRLQDQGLKMREALAAVSAEFASQQQAAVAS